VQARPERRHHVDARPGGKRLGKFRQACAIGGADRISGEMRSGDHLLDGALHQQVPIGDVSNLMAALGLIHVVGRDQHGETLAGEGLTVLVSTHYMDEAERCHEIAYIAYGDLLVHGTVEQVIAASHLTTYAVSTADGTGLAKFAEELATRPGIDMVAPFGTSLHVSGRDQAALEAAVAPDRNRPGLTWTHSQPTLEDVFIDLMAKSQDNFQ